MVPVGNGLKFMGRDGKGGSDEPGINIALVETSKYL